MRFCTCRDGDIIRSNLGKKLQNIIQQVGLKVINKEPTRVTDQSSTLIDLIIVSKNIQIKKITNLELGISDHMLINGIIKTQIKRPHPKIVRARSYKNFNPNKFQQDLETAPWSVCFIFDSPDDCYWAWCKLFADISDAPYREIKLSSVSLHWISAQIRHKMNRRFKLFKRAKSSNDPVLWSDYKIIRNEVTNDVRMAKCNYYKGLFDEVKNICTYWKLIKMSTNSKQSENIVGIRRSDGLLDTKNGEIAEELNGYFANVGENLNSCLRSLDRIDTERVMKVTPTIMNIELTWTKVHKEIVKLKQKKAGGPDNISPKLLKFADKSIVYLLSYQCSKFVPRLI